MKLGKQFTIILMLNKPELYIFKLYFTFFETENLVLKIPF